MENKVLHIFTEEEAEATLKLEKGTLKSARRRHIISYLKGNPVTYLPEHLVEYNKRREVKRCEDNQGSGHSLIKTETEYLPIGISTITKENAVSASLQGTKLARKTMKRTSRSPASRSNASAR